MNNTNNIELEGHIELNEYERLDMMIERNTSFDENMNMINYQKLIVNLISDLNTFKDIYHKNLAIIASGGHTNLVEMMDEEIWIDIIDKEVKKENKLIEELDLFYHKMEDLVLNLRYFMEKEKDVFDLELDKLGEKL